jgi:hypothetical protein
MLFQFFAFVLLLSMGASQSVSNGTIVLGDCVCPPAPVCPTESINSLLSVFVPISVVGLVGTIILVVMNVYKRYLKTGKVTLTSEEIATVMQATLSQFEKDKELILAEKSKDKRGGRRSRSQKNKRPSEEENHAESDGSDKV